MIFGKHFQNIYLISLFSSPNLKSITSRGGVKDTRLEAKDTKKSKAKDIPIEGRPSQGQGQECSRPRTQRGSDFQEKKKVFAPKLPKFFVKFKRSPGKKCRQIFFRKLSGVLQDATKIAMTLAHFQQVKK